MLFAFLAAAAINPPPAPMLSFNAISGESTAEDVVRRFPKAQKKNNCSDASKKIAVYADGPSLCQFLKVESYDLGGYQFKIDFFFYPSGGLKTAALSWPDYSESKVVSDQHITNAYSAVLSQIVAKYGAYVKRAPCELIGNLCAEWQMDKTEFWHAGGERIELEAETKLKIMRGITLSYRFADRRSFNSF